MRYTVSVSEVRILGHLWWPMAPLAATCKQLDSYDVQNIPRGCALYIVPNEYLPDGTDISAVYNSGIAVCV